MKIRRKQSKKLNRRIVAWETTILDLKRHNSKALSNPEGAFRKPGSQKK